MHNFNQKKKNMLQWNIFYNHSNMKQIVHAGQWFKHMNMDWIKKKTFKA